MIEIKVKENESIDRALKRFKKKFQQTGTLAELKDRSYFEKPSISRRTEKIKAAYRQKMQQAEQQSS
jgi:small subunit ribosomal protein S21